MEYGIACRWNGDFVWKIRNMQTGKKSAYISKNITFMFGLYNYIMKDERGNYMKTT